MRNMQLRDNCPEYPGQCRCGSQQGPIVDTMLNDQVGRVYVCARCATSIAGLHGYVSADTAGDLEAEIARLREHVTSVEAQLGEAQAEQVKVVAVSELAELVARRD